MNDKTTWQEDLLNDLTKLQLDYYDKGSLGYTVAPHIDAKFIIDKVSALLKEQREMCADTIPTKIGRSVLLWRKMVLRGISNDVASLYEDILNTPDPKEK